MRLNSMEWSNVSKREKTTTYPKNICDAQKPQAIIFNIKENINGATKTTTTHNTTNTNQIANVMAEERKYIGTDAMKISKESTEISGRLAKSNTMNNNNGS